MGCAVSGAGETSILSRGVLGGASSEDGATGADWDLGLGSDCTGATGPLSDADMASREEMCAERKIRGVLNHGIAGWLKTTDNRWPRPRWEQQRGIRS